MMPAFRIKLAAPVDPYKGRRLAESIGTLLAPGVTQQVVGAQLSKALPQQEMASPLQMLELYNQADLPIIPTEKLKGLRNAGFVDPEIVPRLEEELRKPEVARYRSVWDRIQNRLMENRARRVGAIIYDPYFKRVPIMAHEVGHAGIHHGKSGALPAFIQKHLYGPGLVQTFPTSILAYVAKRNNMRYGAAGSALSLPFLLSEFLATRNGLKYMKGMGASDEELDKARSILGKAYGTYATQAAMPLAAGAAATIRKQAPSTAPPITRLAQRLKAAVIPALRKMRIR
jgi:hypothetical protein